MRRAVDDAVLGILVQLGKVGHVARHPNHKPPVVLRLLLGGAECFVIHYVDLNMLAAVGKKGLDNTLNGLDSLLPRYTVRVKAKIEESSVMKGLDRKSVV